VKFWSSVRLLRPALRNPPLRIGESFQSSDKKCLVVDVEPTDKSVTKIGKHSYRTEKQAEADPKKCVKN
jgi:hypothetical protein